MNLHNINLIFVCLGALNQQLVGKNLKGRRQDTAALIIQCQGAAKRQEVGQWVRQPVTRAGGQQVGRAVGGDRPAPTCQGCPSAPMLTVPEARTPARPVPDVRPSRGHPQVADAPCPQPVPSLGQALSTQIPPCSLLLIPHAFMHPQSLSCVRLFCDPMDCGPPGSSVHGISQARKLEWVVISSSRGSFPARD